MQRRVNPLAGALSATLRAVPAETEALTPREMDRLLHFGEVPAAPTAPAAALAPPSLVGRPPPPQGSPGDAPVPVDAATGKTLWDPTFGPPLHRRSALAAVPEWDPFFGPPVLRGKGGRAWAEDAAAAGPITVRPLLHTQPGPRVPRH